MAPNSSKNLPALMPSKAKNGNALVNEKIDERILRLLNLEDVFDIDYDTYASLLRERMAAARMKKQTLPTEEVEMVTNEWKRIKGKKGRFKVKKITAASFKKGTAVGMNIGKQKLLPGVKQLALPPADKVVGGDPLQEIIGLLGEIIQSLTQQNKDQKKESERGRKESEDASRALQESKLESGFKKAIQVAEKIVAPIKSLLSRIIDFITTIFIGRALYLLLDWFGKKENREKLAVIGRFFGDHWPKLLALYIRFGTQFGRFVGGLSKLVIVGTLKLVQIAAKLIGAKGAAKFLGGRGGKLLGAGLQVAATVGTTMALSSGIENFGGIGGPEQQPKEPKTPTFSGGGLANFKKLLGFFGGGPGYVDGQKGVDKIPAMLSDGEFVMSRGAVQKYGVNTLEAMNAAGGGTNKPRVVSGTAFAQGGGYIGKSADINEKPPEKTFRPDTEVKSLSTTESQVSKPLNFQQRLQNVEYQLKSLANVNLSMGDFNIGNKVTSSTGGNKFSVGGSKYFSMNLGDNLFSIPPIAGVKNMSRVFRKEKPLSPINQEWAKANPKLAAAEMERRRIRGTSQTDNPLINQSMRARMPVTPTVQAPEVAKLGTGYQGLMGNPYAGKSPTLTPIKPSAPELKVANVKPNLKAPTPPPQPKVVVNTISASGGTEKAQMPPSTGGVPQVPAFSAAVPLRERRAKALIMNIF